MGYAAQPKRGKSRSKRRGRTGPTWGQRIRTFLGCVVTLLLIGSAGAIGYIGYVFQHTVKTLPSADLLTEYQPGGITYIYATDKDPKTGKNVELGRFYGKYKEFIPITEIPDVIKNATIAIEDERFYHHAGFDTWAIGRALYRNFRAGSMSEGASTLTQQLARNVFLNNKKTLNRKIQELLLAVQIERNFSKEQILEMYLNEVCYGANTFGIKAAAKVYFNKPLSKLTLGEAALLAGLPQRPTAFEPFEHLPAAVNRRNMVLAKMQELKFVQPEAVAKALKEKPKIAPEPDPEAATYKAPHFTNYVLRQLIKRYGRDKVYGGGLQVYTTLNWEMQQQAEKALRAGVKAGKGDGVTEGAIVTVEPVTGYIRAMAGGVNYDKDEWNYATQGGRQPGSTFKAFVYTAAFMSGKYDPESSVDDSPVKYGKWTPHNYGGGYHGWVSVRTAFMHSFNIPAVRVGKAVGIENVITVARKMGINSPLQPNLALSLGSTAVTPLEMASAYATYPNRGSHASPMSIIRVIDAESNLVENNAPQVERQVIPESVAAEMSSMFADVVQRGTAASAAGIHEVEEAHGKTGTTSDNRDAWFVGYTPELSTAVWVCGQQRVKKGNKIVKRYPPMEGVTGGHVCAPIWAAFMKTAVPIQRRAIEANRNVPENVVPKNADIKAGLLGKSGKNDGDSEEMQIPRARSERRRRRQREEEPAPEPAVETTPAPNAPVQGASPDTPEEKAPAAPAKENTEKQPAEKTTEPAVPVEAEPPAPKPEPETPTQPQASARRLRSAPIRLSAASSRIMVTVCADSGKRATQWCPETVTRSASLVGRGYCHLHGPRTGDQ